ncbi:MobA/MobL family protein [Paraburkholderia sp.]|uniref:MobA/MobL family protein n=1 Tax=Paraburkholderia sp. TaxID=1926495 RepID=UPI003C7C8755
MSTYHLSIKSGRPGTAANHATYIAREGKHRQSLEAGDLLAMSYGNLPEWANSNPCLFWRMSDRYERANGAAYREYEVALPHELKLPQQQELVEQFIQTTLGSKPYQYAIHSPTGALSGHPQPHAHIMFSDRVPDGIERLPEQHFGRYNAQQPESGGCRKDSGGKDRATLREEVVAVRESWARLQNCALQKNGHASLVDHRSNEARGIERDPERHLGQAHITKMLDDDKARYIANRQTHF